MMDMHPSQCRWCGCIHHGCCPRVESIEYYPDGAVKSVKFRTAMQQTHTAPSLEDLDAVKDMPTRPVRRPNRMKPIRKQQHLEVRLKPMEDET